MAYNCFEKKIILLNKKKIQLLTNAKSDKFLKKLNDLNILLLLKSKKVVLYTIGIISYNN